MKFSQLFGPRPLPTILSAIESLRSEIQSMSARLDRIEKSLDSRQGMRGLLEEREKELADERRRIERLSAQGLHVVELLHEARAKISRMEHGGS